VGRLLSDLVEEGGPLLYHSDSTEEQRSFVSTCRKFRRFLTQSARERSPVTHRFAGRGEKEDAPSVHSLRPQTPGFPGPHSISLRYNSESAACKIHWRNASLSSACFQLVLALLPVWHQTPKQTKGLRAMLAMTEMAQFVENHVVDASQRSLDERCVKEYPVSPVATAPSASHSLDRISGKRGRYRFASSNGVPVGERM
jgi:hypothetical protein